MPVLTADERAEVAAELQAALDKLHQLRGTPGISVAAEAKRREAILRAEREYDRLDKLLNQ